jgi:hypothetical protein
VSPHIVLKCLWFLGVVPLYVSIARMRHCVCGYLVRMCSSKRSCLLRSCRGGCAHRLKCDNSLLYAVFMVCPMYMIGYIVWYII